MSKKGREARDFHSPAASQEGLALYVELVQVSNIRGTSDSQVGGMKWMDESFLPISKPTTISGFRSIRGQIHG